MSDFNFYSDLESKEQELKKTKDRFQIITENIIDVIAIIDGRGKFIYISPNNEKITGWKPEELLGTDGLKFVYPDDLGRLKVQFDKLVSSPEGTTLSDEFRYRCSDNTYRTIILSGMNLLDNPSINGLLLNFHDITKVKETQLLADEEAERYRTLIESTNDLIWSVDPVDFGLISFNTTLVRYFENGRGIQIKQGMTVEELLPPDRVEEWYDMYKKALAQGAYTIDYSTVGGEQNLQLSICPMVVDKRVIGISVFGRNLTQLKRMEHSLKSEVAQYRALMESTHDLIWIVESTNWSLTLFNTAFVDFFKKYYSLEPKAGMTPEELVPEKSAEFFLALYNRAINEGAFTLDYETAVDKMYLVFTISPLVVDEKIFGVSVFAEDVTEQVLSKKALETSNEKLSRRLEGAINSISKIGELRDVYTAGHQNRVEKLSCEIAHEMKLSSEEIANISMAARIHDIGKIYVASEILNKPGRISDLEYQIIQTHSQHGFDITNEIDFSVDIPNMILQHHERMDGTGYPQKLLKEDILLGSRIISVADTVEAMSSHRPYRPALGIEAALDEIVNFKGTKYDENVVDACIRLFRESRFEFEKD